MGVDKSVRLPWAEKKNFCPAKFFDWEIFLKKLIFIKWEKKKIFRIVVHRSPTVSCPDAFFLFPPPSRLGGCSIRRRRYYIKCYIF